jgi:DDE superfamily endonuclease
VRFPRATRPSGGQVEGGVCGCSACHRDMTRPPLDHLRVPLTELEDESGGRVPSVAHTRSAERGDTSARRGDLDCFRQELYTSLTARADALFELTDAVLCADGPVRSLVDLTLVAEHRRGHGAMYDALSHGRVEPERIRRALASLPLPRTSDGRIVLAVDVTESEAILLWHKLRDPRRSAPSVHGAS